MEGHGVFARGVAVASCSLSFPGAAAADGDGGRERLVCAAAGLAPGNRGTQMGRVPDFGFPLLLLRAKAARPLLPRMNISA